MLECKTCGAPVKQDGDKLVRTCEHETAPIVANLTAEAKGSARIR